MFNHVLAYNIQREGQGVLGILIVSRNQTGNQTGKKETQRKLIVLLTRILSSVKKR